MSYYNRNRYRTRPERQGFTEAERAAWHEAVAERYDGLRFVRDNELYADVRRGYVYAGSEYVATLGATNAPEDARDWSPSILAIPYHLPNASAHARSWEHEGGRA